MSVYCLLQLIFELSSFLHLYTFDSTDNLIIVFCIKRVVGNELWCGGACFKALSFTKAREFRNP